MDKKEETKAEEAPSSYKLGWYDRLPYWLKAVTIRFWFCGAVYFFVDFGLGAEIYHDAVSNLEVGLLIIIDGLVYGLAGFFLCRFLLVLSENREGEARWWCIWDSKSIWSVFVYLAEGLLWSYLAHLLTGLIVSVIPLDSPVNWMFREPVTFALIGFPTEMAIVGLKDLAVWGYAKLTHKEAY
jgi:hypothetical protein